MTHSTYELVSRNTNYVLSLSLSLTLFARSTKCECPCVLSLGPLQSYSGRVCEESADDLGGGWKVYHIVLSQFEKFDWQVSKFVALCKCVSWSCPKDKRQMASWKLHEWSHQATCDTWATVRRVSSGMWGSLLNLTFFPSVHMLTFYFLSLSLSLHCISLPFSLFDSFFRAREKEGRGGPFIFDLRSEVYKFMDTQSKSEGEEWSDSWLFFGVKVI